MYGFPFIRQRDARQCGAASLAMVCRYWGKTVSLTSIEDLCDSTRIGVSLKALTVAANELGFETAMARIPADSLNDIEIPTILHWGDNHFVVFLKKEKDRYVIADPAIGKKRIAYEEIVEKFSGGDREGKGIALFLQPGSRFRSSKKSQSPGWTAPLMMAVRELRAYHKYILTVIFALLLGAVLQLVMPFLTRALVDEGIRLGSLNIVWLILLGELMIVAARGFTSFIREWLVLHVAMRINITLISKYFMKLFRLPMSFFDKKLTGDLLQRMTDHTRVQSFLTSQFVNFLYMILSFAIFGVALAVFDWRILMIFLAGAVCYCGWTVRYLRRYAVIDAEMFQLMARSQSYSYEMLTTMQEIKLQGCEKRKRWGWEDIQTDLVEEQLKSSGLKQKETAGSLLINEVTNIAMIAFAASAVINGQMSIGAMMAVMFIIGQLNSPLSQIIGFINSLQDVRLSLERIEDINRREEETRQCVVASPAAPADIVVEHINFKYDRFAPHYVIKNVSLVIPAGKVTAIVGNSGCGKTTLIKLLLGFYPADSGSIRIGDRPVGSLDLREWRRCCGVVMQDGAIFSESIKRNIAVDDKEPDERRLREAAVLACADEFIERLPRKYDTIIGRDGLALSKGQQQRILIARAVYREPSFIFLDEATNSLDATNEKEIVENLDRFYRGRTVVVVAHRLSTVKNADNIIVIDNGEVVEQGTHDRLTSMKGHYYNLVKNQLELGQ